MKFLQLLIEWFGNLNSRLRFAYCQWRARQIVGAYRMQAPFGFDPVNAETLVADVVVPELFTPAAIERTAENSEFWQAGILDNDAQFAAIATGAGKTETMPFWKDLTGSSQIITDTDVLTTQKIAMSGDAAQIHERGNGWSDNDLAGILSGSDPAAAVQVLVGDWWMRDMQVMLLSSLKGVFASAAMSTNNLDIHVTSGSTFAAANFLTAESLIDAAFLMGDAATKLTAIAMHSSVFKNLRKADLIDFIRPSDNSLAMPVYEGLRVIVSDAMPVNIETGTSSNSTYFDTYIFGAGAIAYGVGRKNEAIKARPGSTWEVEFDRVSGAGQNIFYNRRRFVLHPRGVKWLGGTQAKTSPTNTELETGTNWLRVYESKNIRIVRLRHNIDMT